MALIDNQVTHFQNGLNNFAPGDIFNSLKMSQGYGYTSVANDFDVFTAAQWSVGGVGTPTRAQQAGLGGLLRLGNSAASGDNSWLQTVNPTFQITAGKKMFFGARLAVDSISLATSVVGLQIAVAANNFLTPVNGIYFRKAAGASTWEFLNRAAGVETTTGAIATGVDATQINLQFFYDGIADLWAAVNGSVVARITPAALAAPLIGFTVGVQNASAVIRTLDLDYVYVAQER